MRAERASCLSRSGTCRVTYDRQRDFYVPVILGESAGRWVLAFPVLGQAMSQNGTPASPHYLHVVPLFSPPPRRCLARCLRL
jgi:hypothetical protein